jgi:hypothetical protein
MIAADPELVGWLATSKARTIAHIAAELTAAGQKDAAELVQRKADALSHGDISPF